MIVKIKHNNQVCPKYDEPVLPNELGNCSLCGAELIQPNINCQYCNGTGVAMWPNGEDDYYKEICPCMLDLELENYNGS
jgi:hypothetical protein